MPIDIYSMKYSPPCRAVLMTAKQLNIDMNVKNVDLSKGQHLTEEYLKMNPGHTVPTIDDNGFTLYESHAIMQYLCNQYAPNSSLYPKDPKRRALVDRWLCFSSNFFSQMKAAVTLPIFTGKPVPPMALKVFNDSIKLMDSLIGDNKYLAGNDLTIADLSVLAISSHMDVWKIDLTPYPSYSAWLSFLTSKLPYYKEINEFKEGEVEAYVQKRKSQIIAQMK